jgi:peptidoglycan/xylan/chitin deacetylase (PgdA/CDA1 family)
MVMEKMRFETKHFLASLLTAFGRRNEGNAVLMFHTISSRDDIFSYPEEKFIKLIKSLKNVIAISDINKKDGVCLTFDDGYKDNLLTAYPILKKENKPFTVFVATDLLGKHDYLTIEDVKKLSEDPIVTIGAHGHTHRALATLDTSEAKSELELSKKILEEITGKKVNSMSFPHGSYDKTILSFAKKLGYQMIGTSDFGLHVIGQTCIKRIAIYRCDTLRTVKSKIDGKWNFLSRKL